MASEKFMNNAQSSLNGDVSSSATTLVVTSGTPFPASAQFRLLIDSEIMLVTSISGGTTFTVTRAQEGTAAAFHANGSLVSGLWTVGALNQSIADCCQVGTFGSVPAAEKAGRLYFCTDTLQLLRDNGSAWVEVFVKSADVAPAATDGATITFDLSQGHIQQVTLGGNRTLALSNEPPNGPFTIILKQDGSGSRSVTWWSNILWANGVTPTLTTTNGKRDMFVFVKLDSTHYLGSVAGQNY